jgi:hypothetical protein
VTPSLPHAHLLGPDLLAKNGHFSWLFAKSEHPSHAKTVFSGTLSRFWQHFSPEKWEAARHP